MPNSTVKRSTWLCAMLRFCNISDLTALSANMATRHYPAIESAKRLLTVLYAQLNSEKKYLAVRDATFLQHFRSDGVECQYGYSTLPGDRIGQKAAYRALCPTQQ